MKDGRKGALGPSKAARQYMDRKISSYDYFRAVRKETAREVARELKEPPRPATSGSQ
jgi:hypothetical protein